MTTNPYSFLEQLPPVVSGSDISMQLWVMQLQVLLQNVTNDLYNHRPVTPVMVQQTSEPSQIQWESAWTSAGYTLPIDPWQDLVWYNTSNSTFGGFYGTTPLSTTVVRREPQNPKSGTNYINRVSLSAAVTSSTNSIGVGNTSHPSLTFTIPTTSDLLLTYDLSVILASGTGQWGGDFLLDGLKVGTQYNALPSNVGLVNVSSSGRYVCRAWVPNVAAGSHTVQVIFGVTGSPASPPALTYGGIGSGANQYGLRTLEVQAVTK